MSSAPLAYRRRVLGCGVESPSGTLATLTAAMANTEVIEAKMVEDGIFEEQRRPQGARGGTIDRPKGAMKGKLTFKTMMRYGDATLTLLRGCGGKLDTSTITLADSYADRSTLSFWLWEDGRVKKMAGCSGDVTIEGEYGKLVQASWDFTGIFMPPAAGAMPASVDLSTPSYVAKGLTLTLGGSALPLISKFSLKLGNSVSLRPSIVSTTALAHATVDERNPMMTLDPEARVIANHDVYGLFLAGTTAALQLVLADGANTFTIDAPRAQRVTVGDEDRDGKAADPIELELHGGDGEDPDPDLTLTESAA